MDDVLERLKEARDRHRRAENELNKVVGQVDQAKASIASMVDSIKELGYGSVKEASEDMKDRREGLDAKLEALRAILDKIEGVLSRD